MAKTNKQKNRAKRFQQRERTVDTRQRTGILSYDQYIASEHWKETKEAKRRAEPKVCASCGGLRRICCHHMCYRMPFDTVRLADLMWLCKDCHELYHSQRETPLSFRASPARLRAKTLELIDEAIQERDCNA